MIRIVWKETIKLLTTERDLNGKNSTLNNLVKNNLVKRLDKENKLGKVGWTDIVKGMHPEEKRKLEELEKEARNLFHEGEAYKSILEKRKSLTKKVIKYIKYLGLLMVVLGIFKAILWVTINWIKL